MKKDFIVRRSITMVEGKPFVETYSEQELIRCKDCKHYDVGENSRLGTCLENGVCSTTEWFCADGKGSEQMKKIVFLALMIILLLTLCSCSHMSKIDDKSYENKVERTRFIKIESYEYGSIVVDSETNVEYWMSEGTYNGGTLTMLVDKSGSPKVRK